jgi:hypothetical protein
MLKMTMKCPVCGKETTLDKTFCEGCGFELHILPKDVSQEVRDYEESRVAEARRRLEVSGAVSARMKEQVENLGRELESRSGELARAREDLEKAGRDAAGLRAGLEEARKNLEQRKAAKAVAFLSCSKGPDTKIYALYDGENRFGCRVRGSSAQPADETAIVLPGTSLVQNHFRILVDAARGHVRVEAAGGAVETPSGHYNLQNGDRFTAGNVVCTVSIP